MKKVFDLQFDTKEFNKLFNNLTGSKLDKSINKALKKVASQIQTDTKPHVPNDTSDLLNSWEIDEISFNEIDAGYNIIYAMYQHQGRREDGTHIILNRPAGGKSFFLKETIDQNLQKYFDMFEKEFFNNLDL